MGFMRDIISPENFEQLKFENRLETPYLGEIRGRNFESCIVYASEIQDADIQIMKTIVSRIGKNSVLILDGDLDQCDSVHFEGEYNGLKAICRSLAGNGLFGAVELRKCERSEVAALADLIV
jgi:PhoH-like ATPase